MVWGMDRKAYPSDVGDEERAFVARHLTLMTEDVPQRDYPLREVYNGLRYILRGGGHAGAPAGLAGNISR